MFTSSVRRVRIGGALLGLVLLAPGCAHKREAYYPPADGGGGGGSGIVWPWSREARRPVEPPLAAEARPKSEAPGGTKRAAADGEDAFDFDQYRE
jgi:hypothetical protein